MSKTSEWLSLRGTCCLVLGLFSRCSIARSKLIDASWIIPMRDCPTVVTPKNSSLFFNHPREPTYTIEKIIQENPTSHLAPPLPPLKREWKDVLKNIAYLYNNIQQTEGHNKLQTRKKNTPKIFDSIDL